MKIDGQEYSFNLSNMEIALQEVSHNNNIIKCIFSFYDTNNDQRLSESDLNAAFKDFNSMDIDSDKGILTDSEISNGINKFKLKIPNITLNDLKTFIKELSTATTVKNLAHDLKRQIYGPSFNHNTIKLLQNINKTNAAEVINRYKKITESTLANDINDELGLDIDTVKKYVCEPLVEQAIMFNVNISDKNQYTRINSIKALNSYINNLTDKILKAKRLKAERKEAYFGNETTELMNQKVQHSTKLLEIAQDSLGIIEVDEEEYNEMSEVDKEKTQMHIVGLYGGNADDSWCAYTVSYLADKAGMNIGGVKSSVYKNRSNSWVSWAKRNRTWREIPTIEMTKENYIKERANREKVIKSQLSQMHEGDFIVWSAQYLVTVDNDSNKFNSAQASHIGIIESVDTVRGTVTIIEGNANIAKTGSNTDRILVAEKEGDPVGNQQYGEYREINPRDGLIRKVYTIEDLAKFGYSGFIDNSKIIK